MALYKFRIVIIIIITDDDDDDLFGAEKFKVVWHYMLTAVYQLKT